MRKIIFFLILGIFLIAPAEAIWYTSSGSGDWNNPATWGGAGIPGAGDNASIATTHTVFIAGAGAVERIELNGTLQLRAGTTLTFDNVNGAGFGSSTHDTITYSPGELHAEGQAGARVTITDANPSDATGWWYCPYSSSGFYANMTDFIDFRGGTTCQIRSWVEVDDLTMTSTDGVIYFLYPENNAIISNFTFDYMAYWYGWLNGQGMTLNNWNYTSTSRAVLANGIDNIWWDGFFYTTDATWGFEFDNDNIYVGFNRFNVTGNAPIYVETGADKDVQVNISNSNFKFIDFVTASTTAYFDMINTTMRDYDSLDNGFYTIPPDDTRIISKDDSYSNNYYIWARNINLTNIGSGYEPEDGNNIILGYGNVSADGSFMAGNISINSNGALNITGDLNTSSGTIEELNGSLFMDGGMLHNYTINGTKFIISGTGIEILDTAWKSLDTSSLTIFLNKSVNMTGNGGTSFNLNISYTDAEAAYTEADYVLIRWDGAAWNDVAGSAVNTAENIVYAKGLTTSSVYAIGEIGSITFNDSYPRDGTYLRDINVTMAVWLNDTSATDCNASVNGGNNFSFSSKDDFIWNYSYQNVYDGMYTTVFTCENGGIVSKLSVEYQVAFGLDNETLIWLGLYLVIFGLIIYGAVPIWRFIGYLTFSFNSIVGAYIVGNYIMYALVGVSLLLMAKEIVKLIYDY